MVRFQKMGNIGMWRPHFVCVLFVNFFFRHYYSWCSITKKQCASFFIVSVIACREKGRSFVKCWKFYVFFLLVCYGTCLQLLLVHIKAATRVNTAKEKQLKTKIATMCVDMWSRRKHWHLMPHVCAVVERLRWNLLPALGNWEPVEWNGIVARAPPETCFQLSPCYDHRCFRVCTYVCRKVYELYFLYRYLISVFKRHKKNNELKKIYIYMFVCKLTVFVGGKKGMNTSALWEASCWMLKSLCEM